MKFPMHTGLLSCLALSLSASDSSMLESLNNEIIQTAQVATQNNQNIDYQPFILSVLPTEDLSKFGVKTLGDALTLIPGIDMATNTMNNRAPIFRGSNPTAYGQSTLVIDGFVVNDSVSNNYNSYLDLPIELIERIEVVRGSGSFIEGVNGYAGTINVITHAHADFIKGEKGAVFASGGSSRAMGIGGWSQYKGENYKLSLDAFTQHNDKQTPTSVTDSLGKSGYAHLGIKNSGFGVMYEYGPFQLNGRFNDYKSDSAFGNLNALPNPGGTLGTPSWYVQGKYTLLLDRNLDIVFKTSIMEDKFTSDALALPIGTYGGVPFNEGYWASLMVKSRSTKSEVLLHYDGLKSHHITTGFESKWNEAIDMYSITTNKLTGSGLVDYTYLNNPSTGLPLAFIDAAHAKRQSNNLYLSDMMTINDQTALALTVGMIHTSDIASNIYGRLALVYQPTRNDIFKIMGSSGNRYPSFQEMYATPSRYATGNPNLSYEKVHSIESQYLRKLNTNLTAGINLFYTENSNQIVRDTTNTFQNYGKNVNHGVEVELRGKLTPYDTLALSYSYIHGEVKDINGNNNTLPYTASNLIKVAYAYDLTDDWSLGGVWNYVGSKKRYIPDTRGDLAAYNTLDFTLGWNMNITKGWYAQCIVKNIANTIVYYPSPALTYPNDYPVADRSFWIRTGWKF